MSETPLTTQAAEPSLPETISVTSNSTGDTVSIVNGFVRLQYYESITLDSIRASYIFNDTGGAVDGKTVREGLPLVGTEEIELKFEDNNGNVIHFSADTDNKKGKYIFRVSDHTTFYIFVDEAYESLVITYTWNNGKEAQCNSLYLTKQELSFGKDHCDELMWQLTKPSGDVYKWEYKKEV